MCLAYCRVRELLYDTDTDAVCGVCPHNFPEAGCECRTCRHQRGGGCGLTAAPLPARGWCCHHNAGDAPAAVAFTEAHLWGAWRTWGVARVLDWYGVTPDAASLVALADFNAPLTYGIPVQHWAEQWWADAETAPVETLPAGTLGEFCVKL